MPPLKPNGWRSWGKSPDASKPETSEARTAVEHIAGNRIDLRVNSRRLLVFREWLASSRLPLNVERTKAETKGRLNSFCANRFTDRHGLGTFLSPSRRRARATPQCIGSGRGEGWSRGNGVYLVTPDGVPSLSSQSSWPGAFDAQDLSNDLGGAK
jgi:hypothetical protein